MIQDEWMRFKRIKEWGFKLKEGVQNFITHFSALKWKKEPIEDQESETNEHMFTQKRTPSHIQGLLSILCFP